MVLRAAFECATYLSIWYERKISRYLINILRCLFIYYYVAFLVSFSISKEQCSWDILRRSLENSWKSIVLLFWSIINIEKKKWLDKYSLHFSKTPFKPLLIHRKNENNNHIFQYTFTERKKNDYLASLDVNNDYLSVD
jgi:hypothetical protein